MASTKATLIGSALTLAAFAAVVIGVSTGNSINNDMPRKTTVFAPTTTQQRPSAVIPTGAKATPTSPSRTPAQITITLPVFPSD